LGVSGLSELDRDVGIADRNEKAPSAPVPPFPAVSKAIQGDSN
jgi:hypothetical protein